MSATVIAFRLAAVLWVVWGLVHAFAGVMTIVSPPEVALANIADGAVRAQFLIDHPPGSVAVLRQHGWNLLWIGVTTTVCAPSVWQGKGWPIFIAALVGGFADLGYFLFLDLGGFVNFVPGTIMTLVSATAIVASAWAYRASMRDDAPRRS